jgi:hypothetical protein
MSARPLPEEVTVTCPACGAPRRVALVLVADAGADPAWTARAVAGELHRLVCRACQHPFRAATPLLYLDAGRRLAVACVPPGAGDGQEVAGALVAHWLTTSAVDEAPDWALSPLVTTDPAELARLAAQGPSGAERVPTYGFSEALDLARHQGAEAVVELLTSLATVADLSDFLALANEHPDLLAPWRRQKVEALANWARRHEMPTAAEALGDLAALLAAHTPAEETPVEVEEIDLLVAGDLDAAGAHLDKPDPRLLEARRATQTVEPEDAERREGFVAHAQQFGALLDDMLQLQAPDEPLPTLAAPSAPGVPAATLGKLLAAATPDLADDALADHPELLTPPVRDALRRAVAAALDRGEEGLAAHYEMLLNALYIATGDTLLDDEDDQP